MLTSRQTVSVNYADLSSKWRKIFDLDHKIESKHNFTYFYKYEDAIACENLENELNKYYLVNVNKIFCFLVDRSFSNGEHVFVICSLTEILSRVLKESQNLEFFRNLTNIVLETMKHTYFQF